MNSLDQVKEIRKQIDEVLKDTPFRVIGAIRLVDPDGVVYLA